MKSKYDFPTREHWIRAVVDDEGSKNPELAKSGLAFLTAQESYRSGNSDVIYGLIYLDKLEDDFLEEYRKSALPSMSKLNH